MTLAIAIHDRQEAEECISYAISRIPQQPGGVTIIGIARVSLLCAQAVVTGMIDPAGLARDAVTTATDVARAAIGMLPGSVGGVFFVCEGWRDPCLRRYLTRSRCDQLIVANGRWGINRATAQLALRGTGVAVRYASPNRSQLVRRRLGPPVLEGDYRGVYSAGDGRAGDHRVAEDLAPGSGPRSELA